MAQQRKKNRKKIKSSYLYEFHFNFFTRLDLNIILVLFFHLNHIKFLMWYFSLFLCIKLLKVKLILNIFH